MTFAPMAAALVVQQRREENRQAARELTRQLTEGLDFNDVPETLRWLWRVTVTTDQDDTRRSFPWAQASTVFGERYEAQKHLEETVFERGKDQSARQIIGYALACMSGRNPHIWPGLAPYIRKWFALFN